MLDTRYEYLIFAESQGWDVELCDNGFYTGLSGKVYKDPRTDAGWPVWKAARKFYIQAATTPPGNLCAKCREKGRCY
jgi:hypothetical protein